MPFVDNSQAKPIPWRPNYESALIAGKDQGVDCSLSQSVIEPGAGAPLHHHPVDELIVILEGTLDFRLGDERREVGPNHTVVIPGGVPHGFTVVGDVPARLMGFLPRLGAFTKAVYLEGGPPPGAIYR